MRYRSLKDSGITLEDKVLSQEGFLAEPEVTTGRAFRFSFNLSNRAVSHKIFAYQLIHVFDRMGCQELVYNIKMDC